ncbi:MAG: SEC-C metal-binding domain-containing protein [Pseudomonadota bacterium]
MPRNLIDECARRGEAMLDLLSGLLDDDRYWCGDQPPGEWWLLLHAVMILGLIPEARAGLLLVEFMRRMSQADDHNLQDWCAGYWPALFRNKPDEVQPALRALCADRGLDWYIRANGLDACTAAAQRQGDETFEEALAWLAKIAADETEDWHFRLSAGNTLLDFPRAQYRPLLEALAARQRGLGAHFVPEDVRNAYSLGDNQPEWERFKNPWLFYSPQAIEGRQRRWQEEDVAIEEDDGSEDDDTWLNEVGMPYVRPMPKVGRNDPCPCGSGRKYKKCCLAGT